MWFDEGMQWLAMPSDKHGRSQTFSDAAIQFCQGIKCLVGQPLRQTLDIVHMPAAPGKVGPAAAGFQLAVPTPETLTGRTELSAEQVALAVVGE